MWPNGAFAVERPCRETDILSCRQMRDSAFKSDLFSGGRGGQAFQEMHDQHLAEHMARGAGRSLAASIVRHIERRGRAPETQSATRRPPDVASTR